MPGAGDLRKSNDAGFARQLAGMRPGGELAVGTLDARRDLLDVRDVVRAYRFLANQGESGTAYNVCSGHAVAIREALELLLAEIAHPVSVRVDPDRMRPVDIPLLMGNPARIRSLGWAPAIPLRETLRDLIQAQRADD